MGFVRQVLLAFMSPPALGLLVGAMVPMVIHSYYMGRYVNYTAIYANQIYVRDPLLCGGIGLVIGIAIDLLRQRAASYRRKNDRQD